MDERCIKHMIDEAAGYCRLCHHGFCEKCLVFPFGPKKPPYCVACALAAAGVRLSAGNRPAAPPERRADRVPRRSARAARRQAKTAELEAAAQPGSHHGVIPAPHRVGVRG